MKITKPKNPILDTSNQLSNGLIAAWLFNSGGGSDILDYSPYRGNSGTLQSGATWTTNYRVSLDDTVNGWINFGDNNLYSFTTRFYSIVVGIRMRTITSEALLQKGFTNGQREYRFFVVDSTTIRAVIGGGTGNWVAYDFSVPTMSANTDYNIALTMAGTVARVYLDGVESSTGGTNVAGAAAVNGTEVLRAGYNGSQTTDGELSYIYMYNRPLIANEVRVLHKDPYTAFRKKSATTIVVISTTSTVQLSWADNSGGTQTFSIERSTTGPYSGFTEIATGESGPTYNDTNLAPGTYWYRVRGIVGSEYSDYINPELIAVT